MARARSGSEPRTSRGPREAPAPGSRIGAWKGKGPGRGGSVPATPLPASRRRSGNWGGAGGAKAGQHRPRTAPAPPPHRLRWGRGRCRDRRDGRARTAAEESQPQARCVRECVRAGRGRARVLTGWCQRRRAPRRGRSSSSKPESALLVWGSFNCSKLHTLRPFKFPEVS